MVHLSKNATEAERALGMAQDRDVPAARAKNLAVAEQVMMLRSTPALQRREDD